MGVLLSILLILNGLLLPQSSAQEIQASSKDVQHKNAAIAAFNDMALYQKAHGGKSPSEAEILDKSFIDANPAKTVKIEKNYTFIVSGDDAVGTIKITLGKKCDGKAVVPQTFSVSTLFEDGTRFCQSN